MTRLLNKSHCKWLQLLGSTVEVESGLMSQQIHYRSYQGLGEFQQY